MQKFVCCAALAVAILLVPIPGSFSLAAALVASPTPASRLSPDVVAKLLKLMTEKGVVWQQPGWIGTALGFSVSGQTWPSRWLDHPDKDGVAHGLGISLGAEQDLVMTVVPTGRVGYGYRLRRDGTVMAAFSFDPQTRQLKMLDPAEAQKSVDPELALWSDIAATNN